MIDLDTGMRVVPDDTPQLQLAGNAVQFFETGISMRNFYGPDSQRESVGMLGDVCRHHIIHFLRIFNSVRLPVLRAGQHHRCFNAIFIHDSFPDIKIPSDERGGRFGIRIAAIGRLEMLMDIEGLHIVRARRESFGWNTARYRAGEYATSGQRYQCLSSGDFVIHGLAPLYSYRVTTVQAHPGTDLAATCWRRLEKEL